MSDIWSLLSSFDQILSNVTTLASGIQSSVNTGNITSTSGTSATTAYNNVLTIQAQLNTTYSATQADLDFWKQLKADNQARGNTIGVQTSQQMIDSLVTQLNAVQDQQFQASQVASQLAVAQAAVAAAALASQIAAQAAAAQAAAQLAAQQAAQAAAQAAAAQQAAAQEAARQAAAEQAARLAVSMAAQAAEAQAASQAEAQAAQAKAAADAEAARQAQIRQAQAQEAARQQAEADAAARAKAEAEAEAQRQSAISRAAQEAQMAAQIAQAQAAAQFAEESRTQDALQNQGSFTDIITIVGQGDNIAGAKYYPTEPTDEPLPISNPKEVQDPVYAGGSTDFSRGLANEDRTTDGGGDQEGDSSSTGGSSGVAEQGSAGSEEESQVAGGNTDEGKSPFEKILDTLLGEKKPEDKAGTYTENGYSPPRYPFYPPAQPQEESSGTNFLPFGLLIGAGLLFIAKEDKKKK